MCRIGGVFQSFGVFTLFRARKNERKKIQKQYFFEKKLKIGKKTDFF